jgi:hypothetical protein
MRHSMIAALSIAGTLAFALPAIAQDYDSPPAQPETAAANLGSVVQGNTTIEFAPAGTDNLDVGRLQTWGEFAEAHPQVAKALAYNNSLMGNHTYLSKHPELSSFFEEHPDIRQAMAENPGNFVAIPPRPGE